MCKIHTILYIYTPSDSETIILFLASEEDVDTSTVTIKFRRSQRKAVGTVKIFSDDVVERVELFAVRMILPSREIRKGRLKYGSPRHILVYIRDSKCSVFEFIHKLCKAYCG